MPEGHDLFKVFEGVLLKKMDRRKDYGEERWIVLGLLNELPIVLVYTLPGHALRMISARKANRNERKIYFESIKKQNR